MVGCAEVAATPAPPPPKVTVQHPEERELVDYDTYNGWTRPSEMVEVRSRVRGHIKKIHFTDGQMVKKGDLLFELDPRPYESDIERAKRQLDVDKAQMAFATAEADRDTDLFSKKAISKAEYERSIAQKDTAVARVAAAKQEVSRLELELEYSRITADISGRISRAQLTEGNLVNAGGTDPILTTIVAIDPIHVYFPVDERALLKYRESRAARNAARQAEPPAAKAADGEAGNDPGAEGDEAKAAAPRKSNDDIKAAKIPFDFGLETEKGYPHPGMLDFADNRIDPGTGTIEVRGYAANADGSFIPGSRVRVQVPISDTYKALLVPDVAILSDQDQRYVLVLNDENVVLRRNIQLGKLLPDGKRVIVPPTDQKHALSVSDWVIVMGLQRARVNDPVEPVDEDGKAISTAKKN
ncbi:MAG: efflux RND transporter periplasmic adaptor subunit [Planctomycetaceae bacterium]|nr:efflux RND transporter periplasmic adaptor subunit [Planctomycetaceae bacterium]